MCASFIGAPEPCAQLGTQWAAAFTFAGFNCLLSCLKLFTYLSLNKRMNLLWLTLQKASYDLAMFFGGFLFIAAGFGFLGNFLYGHKLFEFHDFQSSISSLMRFTLGDFSYDALSQTQPELTPVFFWIFNGIVYLVIMNSKQLID